MKEYVCPDCNYITDKADNYKRHLERKIKCNAGKYKCQCGHTSNDRSNMSKHKKICKGKRVPRSVLEQGQQKVADLEREVADLKKQLEQSGDVEEEFEIESEDDDEIQDPLCEERPRGFDLQSIGDIDAKNNQVYFFECGPAVKPFVTIKEGVLVKFGSTDGPYKRITTHIRDHEGGRLLDSILTNNPKAVEADLKKYMKLAGRIVACKTPKKPGCETEVFLAVTQEDYAKIVQKTKDFVEEYKKNVELLSVYQDRLEKAIRELEALRATDSE